MGGNRGFGFVIVEVLGVVGVIVVILVCGCEVIDVVVVGLCNGGIFVMGYVFKLGDVEICCFVVVEVIS